MLARKYDEYAWDINEEQQEENRQLNVRRRKKFNYALLRRRLAVLAVIILGTYFLAVMRSEALVTKSNELFALKQQETALMLANSEERILVEELKGPERITSIAETQLGMQVARSNIYVKADKAQIAYDGYAYAK